MTRSSDSEQHETQPAADRDPDRDGTERAEKERLLDEALAETFPASDPVAISP